MNMDTVKEAAALAKKLEWARGALQRVDGAAVRDDIPYWADDGAAADAIFPVVKDALASYYGNLCRNLEASLQDMGVEAA